MIEKFKVYEPCTPLSSDGASCASHALCCVPTTVQVTIENLLCFYSSICGVNYKEYFYIFILGPIIAAKLYQLFSPIIIAYIKRTIVTIRKRTVSDHNNITGDILLFLIY